MFVTFLVCLFVYLDQCNTCLFAFFSGFYPDTVKNQHVLCTFCAVQEGSTGKNMAGCSLG